MGIVMKKFLLTLLVFFGFNQGNVIADNASNTNAFSFSFESIEGGDLNLNQYRGKALLIVNTASLCGFTGQYEGLQTLWENYKDKGLIVIGVPANNFSSQEPGNDGEIKEFCETTFGIDFPMTSKVSVKGDDAHPFYKWLVTQSAGPPKWKFHKILINPNGKIEDTFMSFTRPTSKKIIKSIENLIN